MSIPIICSPSAAVEARCISRLLRRLGCTMANTKDRYDWTEGYYVRRVGCSRWVSVSYHLPNHGRGSTKEQMEKAKRLLSERGYLIDARGWIECQTA